MFHVEHGQTPAVLSSLGYWHRAHLSHQGCATGYLRSAAQRQGL